jgi:hypothetical protein
MNDDRDARRGFRRAQSPRMGLLVIVAGVALLTAGCSGGAADSPGLGTPASSSASSGPGTAAATGGSSAYKKAVAYAQCMRQHGVPNFPDPLPNGGFGLSPDVTGGTNGQVSPQYQAAEKACAALSPVGSMSPQQQRQTLSHLLKFSACMRSHGYPNFPDPTVGSDGIVLHIVGFDRNSPQFQAAQRACLSLLHIGAGGSSG